MWNTPPVVSTTNLKGSDRKHDVPIFILQAANTLNLKGNDRVLSHQSQTPRILKGSDRARLPISLRPWVVNTLKLKGIDRQNEDYFLNLEGSDRKGEILLVYKALTGIVTFICFFY